MSLHVDNLRVMLGDKAAVAGVSFDAAERHLTFVVGPNGAGKTTLLRALCGLIPAQGTIAWKGRDLAQMSTSERARALGYVPQGHVAHWPISARTAVAIGRNAHASSLFRLSRADENAIDAALAAVDATEFSERPITELSGGERARVMLARALAVEAPLLILDEPVAALDPAHQIAIVELLQRLAHDDARAILCVVHDLTLAARYGDAVLMLDQGHLHAAGAPGDVLSDDALANVFGISVARPEVDGQTVLLPWRADPTEPKRRR